MHIRMNNNYYQRYKGRIGGGDRGVSRKKVLSSNGRLQDQAWWFGWVQLEEEMTEITMLHETPDCKMHIHKHPNHNLPKVTWKD